MKIFIIIISEFPSAKNLINHANIDRDDGIHDLYSISKILNQLPNAFEETLKIINILMTLPVTTASNERFFSSLKLVKTHLQLTMRNERLSDLLVIAVESDVSGKINLDDAVDIFSVGFFLPIRAGQNLCPPLLKTEMTPQPILQCYRFK